MKTDYNIIGLMSGTSLDGIDIALCHFSRISGAWDYNIVRAHTYDYSNDWRKRLNNAEHLSGLDLCLLDIELGQLTAAYVSDFLNGARVDAIASHGQTIFHQPEKRLTVQLGSAAEIAALTQHTVVCDFRTLDVALGGHGAPLVPIGDKLLFGKYGCCLNLGGFANISFDNDADERLAFDVCPVNIVINNLVQEKGVSFDKDGQIASTGTIHPDLLNSLNKLSYYDKIGPKSLGKEWVIDVILPVLNSCHITLEDKLRTFYEHAVVQLTNNIGKLKGEILVTGGGTHNVFFMELLKQTLPNRIIVPDKLIVDYKEALIFAFLGLLRLENQINCLRSVTGAQRNSICGAVYLGKE